MDEKLVTLASMESVIMHLQTVNKRLAVVTTIALLFMATMFGTFVYFFMGYEVTTEQVTVDSESGPANYIGNDGEINNGISESEENDN